VPGQGSEKSFSVENKKKSSPLLRAAFSYSLNGFSILMISSVIMSSK